MSYISVCGALVGSKRAAKSRMKVENITKYRVVVPSSTSIDLEYAKRDTEIKDPFIGPGLSCIQLPNNSSCIVQTNFYRFDSSPMISEKLKLSTSNLKLYR